MGSSSGLKVRSGRLRAGIWAAASAIALGLTGCGSGSDSSAPAPLVVIEANLDAQVAKIGGATSAAAFYDDGTTRWAVYSMANRLAATPIGTTKGAAPEIELPGYILHIEPIVHDGKAYALVSMGGKGLAVVDLSNPEAMSLLHVVDVNYEKTGLDFVDGGGNPVTDATVSGTAGTITTVTGDGTDLYIGNADFGIHKTAISNLLPVPQLEADGTLVIDTEIWTLQYAGENPWGGPQSLKLHTDGAGITRLYAALGFLGIAIYDPADLGIKPARYNLFTDESVNEDWFGARSLQASVADPAFLDPDTGMPTWEQAEWEINVFWRDGKMDTARCANADWCTPWASFDRYGKYYYQARTLDVVELDPGTPSARTIAYVAYSLGGLVAVDVTDPGNAKYDGYVAAVPAHGPDEPTGTQASSLFPHFGSGMLKEAGVMDVRVVKDATGTGYKAYYSDHFAGLVVVDGAENPQANWKNPGGPYDNDIFPSTPYWPDYEFVTSYDMTPVTPSGSDESIPAFVAFNGGFTSPVLLASGEISGHGGVLFLMPDMDTGGAGQVDVVQATGAGGLNFIDIKGFSGAVMTDYFEVPVRHVSTTEVGAAADGSATQPLAIGHAEGVTVSGNHVFLADGPHGMSAWRIADAAGVPTDDLRLVANTLQSEYPFNGILPTPHAFKSISAPNRPRPG